MFDFSKRGKEIFPRRKGGILKFCHRDEKNCLKFVVSLFTRFSFSLVVVSFRLEVNVRKSRDEKSREISGFGLFFS